MRALSSSNDIFADQSGPLGLVGVVYARDARFPAMIGSRPWKLRTAVKKEKE